jgi:hypothetical protein
MSSKYSLSNNSWSTSRCSRKKSQRWNSRSRKRRLRGTFIRRSTKSKRSCWMTCGQRSALMASASHRWAPLFRVWLVNIERRKTCCRICRERLASYLCRSTSLNSGKTPNWTINKALPSFNPNLISLKMKEISLLRVAWWVEFLLLGTSQSQLSLKKLYRRSILSVT